MTKTEQFLKAVRTNFEAAEPRRQWLRKQLEAYTTKAKEARTNKEIGRDRTAELVAGTLAKQLADLELLTLGLCYLHFKSLFKGEVRLYSDRLKPILEEAKKREYNAHRKDSHYRLFGYEVFAYLDIGPSDGDNYHNKKINTERLTASITELSQTIEAERTKTLADIEAEAQAITIAWDMMVEAERNYTKNLSKLKRMLGNIRYNDEFSRTFSVAVC